MQITCPCCAARYSLDAALADKTARQALDRALQMADMGTDVVRYLTLFRAPSRALSWPRVTRLLDDLCQAIEQGVIRRHGRDWAAPRATWQLAIGIVLERRDAGKLQTPLRNHAYLYQVIVGIAERAEARAEAEVEESRRHRAAGPTPVAEKVGEIAHRTLIRDLPACEREELMEGAFKILGKARRGA